MKSIYIFPAILFYCVFASNNVVRGPYLQIGTPNSIIIRWRTDVATDGRIRYGTEHTNLDQFVDNLSTTSEHEITLSGLIPNTQYFYSVETTTEVLSSGLDHYFVTAPPVGTKRKSRIWILGDSGTANENANSVKEAYYNFTDSTHTDLWVMLGDNAYSSGTDSEYQAAVFEMYPAMLKKSVLWPAFGNHESYSGANSNTQTGVFYDIFTLPTNAEAGGWTSGTEAYYSFDYANIHFICLNSHDIDRSVGGEMCSWLQDDLATTAQEWVIAYWHHPAYSKGSHNSDSEFQLIEMRENVLPILENGGTDLVFYGHSHNYERSFLLDGHYGYSNELTPDMILNAGNGRADGDGPYIKSSTYLTPHEGTVYTTAGSSGKTGGGTLNHPAMYISYHELGSVILDIEGSRADITFLDNNGIFLDYFTMYKGPPVWSDIPDTTFFEDSNLLINLNDYVYDDGDPDSNLTLTISGGKHITANLDAITHKVSFTTYPDSGGYTEEFNVKATDPWGGVDSDTFFIGVIPLNDTPSISSKDSLEATEDQYFKYVATATDPDGPSLIWTFDLLPEWLSSDADSVFGTPLNGDADTLFRIIATDGQLNDTLIVAVTIIPVNDPPNNFITLYPTISDTFNTNSVNNDSIINFIWTESNDLDSEVFYQLRIESEYNNQVFSFEYDEISDTTFSVLSNSFDKFLSSVNLTLLELTWFIISTDGEYSIHSDTNSFIIKQEILASYNEKLLPEFFSLQQNYPNPFNPTTTIRYNLPEQAKVVLTIYDIVGREVRALVKNVEEPGYKFVLWDGTNNYGQQISSGIYLCHLQANEFIQTRKSVFLK